MHIAFSMLESAFWPSLVVQSSKRIREFEASLPFAHLFCFYFSVALALSRQCSRVRDASIGPHSADCSQLSCQVASGSCF